MLQIYIGLANYQENNYTEQAFVLFTMTCLLAFVSYFTVLKFKRIKMEKLEYEKISQLTYEQQEEINDIMHQQIEIQMADVKVLKN